MSLKENRQLATEYEDLMKILMEAKQEAVSALNEKNHAHKSFHYYTQVQYKTFSDVYYRPLSF